ncbi:AAA family ATPase [Acetobacter ascendens]|uniref:AAA+ ATPase domain-containing protein n=1 Tax=Acetobacter ascendens TaxID=481146 RepID=A0A1Y0V1J5_9PROT|nr:AAA family ATPase [Acetobacter ascendens]ARW09986.1 hypothetical protein S101447_00884 [Acetobacter ascendens]
MNEIGEIVHQSVIEAQNKQHTPVLPLVIDDQNWDENDIPSRPWVASGILLRGAVTVVVGAPASGKSSLMVGWAASLALGESYGRLTPDKRMKVMTYNVEDDRDEQRRRFSAALRFMGKCPADLNGYVARVGTETIGTLLEQEKDSKEMFDTPAMKQMEAEIQKRRPDVLMLDPLVELHEAEENDNTAVRKVMAHFRALAVRYDMAVVLLHHTRKGVAAIPGDPDVSRGASAVVGAARVVLTVSVMSEAEAQNFGLPADHRRFFSRVDGAKINAAPIGKEEWFERQSYELNNGDRVAVMKPWMPPQDSVSLEQMNLIEAGVAKGSPVGPWSPKLSKDQRSIRKLLTDCGVSTADGQKKVLNDLLHEGYEVATFRRDNRGTAQGIRTPDGKPSCVVWTDGGGEE